MRRPLAAVLLGSLVLVADVQAQGSPAAAAEPGPRCLGSGPCGLESSEEDGPAQQERCQRATH